MKLLIIRHGDPDYSIDSLTPTGWVEAELLSHRLPEMPANLVPVIEKIWLNEVVGK